MVTSSPRRPDVIPAAATAGDFARVVGVTERAIAGRKADGRLPKLSNGAIDLHAVIRAGVAELARRQGDYSSPAMDPAEAYDAGLRLAANVTARLAVAEALGIPPGEDPGGHAKAAVDQACEMFRITPAAAEVEER